MFDMLVLIDGVIDLWRYIGRKNDQGWWWLPESSTKFEEERPGIYGNANAKARQSRSRKVAYFDFTVCTRADSTVGYKS